jgi:hypothetical protein
MSSKSISIIFIKTSITDQLKGVADIDAKQIKTYDDYQDIFRIRHDLIHKAICDKLGLPFGEIKVEDILKSSGFNFSGIRYYDDVKKQTPDFFSIKGRIAIIFEVTVSASMSAKEHKASKYALLMYFLKKNGFKVDYKIFVFNPQNIYINRLEHITNGLDDLVLDFASEVCVNTQKLLLDVHKTDMGIRYYKQRNDIIESRDVFPFYPEDVIKTESINQNKCFHSHDDFLEIIDKPQERNITNEDNKFLTHLLSKVYDVDSEIQKKDNFSRESFEKEMEGKSTTTELRSIFPLPFIQLDSIDSSVRSTESDFDKLMIISAKMLQSNNTIISNYGLHCQNHLNNLIKKPVITNDDLLLIVKFSQEEKKEIAEEGPGRKEYVRKGEKEHIKKSHEHDGYALSPKINVDELKKVSFFLSDKKPILGGGLLESDMKKVKEIRGPGLDYVRICQSIYREININSMRGDRRKKHVIKPTGIDGVFIILYKGTKLRCGELANIVWFKIIIDNEKIDTSSDWQHHWSFKKIYRDVKVSYTKWLSCDVHRLDHYIRCFDKILMTYSSLCTQKYKTMVDLAVKTQEEKKLDISKVEEEMTSNKDPFEYSLINIMNQDDSNSLGLIIMTYLEDRRSTSKLLQNVRYLVMTSISLFPQYKEVFKKMDEPIRSPLQLYFLRKMLDYVELMKTWKVYRHSVFGSVKYDYKTHTFLDTQGGSNIRLPRPIVDSSSNIAEFSEILCEMYFTMLFNKNQDDPTHASFQILNKIIEGEESFTEVKKDNNHLGYSNCSDEDFADLILKQKHTHMFSRRAIEIGAKLLREELEDPAALQIYDASHKHNINKTIDEFATYKSSATLTSDVYSPLKHRQNDRVKCMEGVMKLLKENLNTSLDVVREKKEQQTYYHVFKKNQIGGVREILILPIESRILINVLETLSRNICKFDKREVLTHGATKNESIKSTLYAGKKFKGTRAPIHITFDKSKWGPGFVPIQFFYLFKPFKKELGNMYYYILDILIRHQNKVCVYPDRLVKAWYVDKNNKRIHDFPGLQKLKEKFLMDNKITYSNESNMGQGILHYTSSYLHLAMIAFRNKMYKLCCDRDKMDCNDHEDLLSSDDSYTLFCPELYQEYEHKFVQKKLLLFLKCQQLSEYMFNCRTSLSKSSVNPLIGEFNSLFITNMTFIPTLIKFAISSVHPPNTDSFYRLVKECYSSSRQIVENGGGLDLYYLSHLLNKDYAESIYHTYPGGHNDLSSYGITKLPYHLGTYPLFNPALMLIFGPEYYNYFLFKREYKYMTDIEQRLFNSSHKMIKGSIIETIAEFEEGDTILGGLMRIEANMGPIKQHVRIKKEALYTQDVIIDMVEKDPLLLLRRPETREEIIFKTCQKLYTVGAAEALKNIAASIYYGRVSATVSAEVFHVPNSHKINQTYKECILRLANFETPVMNLEDQIRFIYPRYLDYDLFINEPTVLTDFKVRNPFEIQTVQSLATHKVYTKLVHSVTDLLQYKWLNKPIPLGFESKVSRDFEIIRLHYPMVKDTLQETRDQFTSAGEESMKPVLMLILKLFSLRDRTFKGVIFGFGSSDVQTSFEVLMERNYSGAIATKLSLEHESRIDKRVNYERIYQAYNQHILSYFSMIKPRIFIWENISMRELNIFMQDPGLNRNIKKRIFMSSITFGFNQTISEWSGSVGLILHSWVLKQKYSKSSEQYTGPFELILFMGSRKLKCVYDDKLQQYNLSKIGMSDPELLYSFIRELTEILKISIDELLSKCSKGDWILMDNKILKSTINGFSFKDDETILANPMINCILTVDDEKTSLLNDAREPLFNIETGLLSTSFTINEDNDFPVFGLSFIKIVDIGATMQNFDVLYKSRAQTLEILDDMLVPKPSITELTQTRLKLVGWNIRVDEKDDAEMLVDDQTPYDAFLSMDTSEMSLDFLQSEWQEFSMLQNMIDFLKDTDAIYSMKTTQRIQQSRKIFNRIRYLKYDLICHQLLFEMKINKMTLSAISQLIQNGNKKYVVYSLISLYDRTYHNEGQRSPLGLLVNMNEELIMKFKLIVKEENEIELD